MEQFKKIMDNILVIASVIYLWLWVILLYKEIIIYKPYQIAIAILALGIYLSDKIDNLKSK
jgi:uncharacterized membrane protein YcfT